MAQRPFYDGHVRDEGGHEQALRHLAEEQGALRRVATLVAAGASEADLLNAVTSEIARLFQAQGANTLRWDGDAIRVLSDWREDAARAAPPGRTFRYGGDTIMARVVESGQAARVDSADDLQTEFGRERWAELGLEASIGAPIVVDGRMWGVVTASRTKPDDPFPPGAEHRLADFAALVAQAVANAEARRQVAALVEEQAALRRVATLVAGGRPEREVVEAAARSAAQLFEAEAVQLVRWNGVPNEVAVIGGWSDEDEPMLAEGALYHPSVAGPTLTVLESGFPQRGEESSPELGARSVIAAPAIVKASLLGALIAVRGPGDPFPPDSEVRLRSFSDLVAQSMANARAQEEMRASRARIVRAADEAREKLERDLHDGAQQRLVSALIALRLAAARLGDAPDEAAGLLEGATDELSNAIADLRELAQGIHPAILTDRGLGPALDALARRAPIEVAIANELHERLPQPLEAAAYYVVAESLTNVAKHAEASTVGVRVTRANGCVRVEVVDDGVGGADPSRGSGLRGLADRVEALAGRLGVESAPTAGTCVWAEIPIENGSTKS